MIRNLMKSILFLFLILLNFGLFGQVSQDKLTLLTDSLFLERGFCDDTRLTEVYDIVGATYILENDCE